MFDQEQQQVEAHIRAFCAENDLPTPDELPWNPIPFSGEWGISTSFFKIAADEARSKDRTSAGSVPVPQRAQQIAEGVASHLGSPAGFSRVEAVNGYLNLYFSTPEFSQRVIDTILNQGQGYGCSPSRDQRVMVEFSQPNTHKAFHVGHLRNVMLGATICNILECAGYDVVRANYIGDIGLHVIKWLWNYINYHDGEEPGDDKTRWMGDLYAEAVRRLEDNPELETEVRALFSRWDQGDPQIVALWEKTRDWSLEGFQQIYDQLGVTFDRVYYESEVEEPGKQLVEEMIERGIAEDERPDGPVIARLDELLGLDKEQYRVLVVLRSDGTSLYATKDLPLAIKKFEEHDLARSIYVIDVRQSLYLQQIFKTLDILGHDWADRCYHLAYEIVNLPGNVTMSSREGTVVLLEDLIREAIARAYQVVQEKNPDLPEEVKTTVSQNVAMGALRYPMLARENTKVVTFDWESALDFNGHAAPYIQYAHVRANSILRRADGPLPASSAPTYALEPPEIQLIDLLSRLPAEVERAAEDYKPLTITNLAYEIARTFNDFYSQCQVLQADPEVRDFRLRLVAAARQTLSNALGLLGIVAPDVM
jgi:arginyl-tRNA synthetase